ncbi:hypothetical protein SAMN02745131_00767 [Flavisolibacter ginsengisoli DSM 18119]|uniref:Uncharacterized protein n=1 Tax=Flavisolibacter ginsengisoli DSM 18119 TaxID=1121884 RepID=A0A1M4UTL8_9BACT|nr:hypothetical protein SAMN02745131_00767 [Flavisolibacter ginsengisoli DSM 18119]
MFSMTVIDLFYDGYQYKHNAVIYFYKYNFYDVTFIAFVVLWRMILSQIQSMMGDFANGLISCSAKKFNLESISFSSFSLA